MGSLSPGMRMDAQPVASVVSLDKPKPTRSKREVETLGKRMEKVIKEVR